MTKGGGGGGSVHIPRPPSFPQEYAQGTNTYMGFLPQYLGTEMSSRENQQYGDPARIAWQQYLQNAYGPTQYNQQLSALGRIDPVGSALRTQEGNAISQELAGNFTAGDTDLVRRAEAARGNVYGQAPVTGEAMNLHRQAIQDAMNFQNSATPEQWISQIAPVSADRSSAYVNPNAGFLGVNAANAAYQNMLARAAAQMQPGGGNAWGQIGSSIGQAAMIAAMFM